MTIVTWTEGSVRRLRMTEFVADARLDDGVFALEDLLPHPGERVAWNWWFFAALAAAVAAVGGGSWALARRRTAR